MRRLFSLRLVVLCASVTLTGTFASAQVPPEIARECAAKWGTDYRMQVYCRNEQMKAYRELAISSPTAVDANMVQGLEAAERVRKKSGLAGLNRAIDKCYAVAKSIGNLKYCIALDYKAYSSEPSGRNSVERLVARISAKIRSSSIVGSDTLSDTWADEVIAATKHVYGMT